MIHYGGFMEPQPWSRWTHRNGGVYVVVGVSTCSTNGPADGVERVVVYYSTTYGRLRHRELSEFMDGRFVELAPDDRDGGTVADSAKLNPSTTRA